MKQITRKGLEKDLVDQLERNGSLGKYYLDLVRDYLELWDTKNALLADIKGRGVTVNYNNGGGQAGIKKNESVEQLLKVNKQMLCILDYLALKPSCQVGDDTDEEM
ncbi:MULTISPECIES: P27 family phage terminase small subunit [Anaerotignum]|uniref:P27 family phage terminase small subunit n=1 Tax=Anaerotignum TaxID=2039240 RepID=UPI000E7EA0A6|nr:MULTISPECIES: P27 family phage terminase small subunit [Anaerotignum]MCQ4936758.1 P27 family phage terminase small subunit [Anaerotignum propionicum]MEA5058383.1 P27 family phage terminase small subunit [Anaerotignum propionicum]HBF65811.1 RNA polymerase subunit sigma-70 [Clostridium sp.]